MKRLVLSLSFLLLCYSTAYANLPYSCDNLDDHSGTCAASDDCVGRCAMHFPLRSVLNPLMPGFLTGFVDHQLIVTGVIPHSPASDAGVMVGDRLIAVDGVRLPGSYGLRAVWQEAREHDLVVERSGRFVHFSVTPVSEQVILAKAWSDFDPLGQRSMELVGFTKRHSAATIPAVRNAFLSGMKTLQKDHQLIVEKVLPGSAAEAAGIHKGDVITHSSTNNMESSDSRSAMDLTVQRGDSARSIHLQMTSISEILRALADKRVNKPPLLTSAGM